MPGLWLSTCAPDLDNEKRLAAEAAAELVEDGMTVGLGTGSTVAHLLPALAARNSTIRCVATSLATEEPGRELGLDVEPFEGIERLDIAIDGADQIAPDGWLVKGGGGAHTREKIVAAAADRFVVIVDSSKPVDGSAPRCRSSCSASASPRPSRELGDAVELRAVPLSPDGGVIADYTGDVRRPDRLAARLSAHCRAWSTTASSPAAMVADVIVGRGEQSSTRDRPLGVSPPRRRRRRRAGSARVDPARRDRRVAGAQLGERLGLVGARDQPEHRARRGRAPGRSASSGGGPGTRSVTATSRSVDVEHRVARDQRGGVAVGAEAEVDQVERARELARRSSAAAASRSSAFDRHRPHGGRAPSAGRLASRWVRLRSGSPSGATRSSTWKTSMLSQAIVRRRAARQHRPRRAAAAERERERSRGRRSPSAAAAAISSAPRRAHGVGVGAATSTFNAGLRLLLVVAAELLAHRRQHLVRRSRRGRARRSASRAPR